MKNAATISRSWFSSFSQWRFKRVDPVLLALVLALLGFGLVMLYSASFIYAYERFADGYLFLKKQVAFAAVGLVGLAIASQIDHLRWRRWSVGILVGATILLALVLIPGIGTRVGGAQRWIRLGIFNIQPAEFAKFALILFTATQLFRKRDRIQNFSAGVLSHVLWVLPAFVLLLRQPDFGSTVISAVMMFTLMFIAGVRIRYLLGALTVGAVSVVGLIASSPYRMQRFLGFIDPWKDPLGKSFQVIQSLMGFHNGKLMGVGMGNGKEKLFYLPEAHSDFLFAVVGEELGLIGVVAIVAAYLLLVVLGIRIARRAYQDQGDFFGMLLAAGITLMLGLQSFINMGVVMGLLPTKGLALPFISYGGSALLMNLFAVGILLSIDRGTARATHR